MIDLLKLPPDRSCEGKCCACFQHYHHHDDDVDGGNLDDDDVDGNLDDDVHDGNLDNDVHDGNHDDDVVDGNLVMKLMSFFSPKTSLDYLTTASSTISTTNSFASSTVSSS